MNRECIVVGAGIVGLAVARQLALAGSQVTVLDKEPSVAAHQTGHNSGVVHSGIYYTPGSLKATLCRRGAGLIRQFCAEHDLAFNEIGKVVVARSEGELQALRTIEERARRNEVPGLAWLDANELRRIEPNVVGVAALHSPTAAIVDYTAISEAMAADIRAAGGQVLLGQQVTGVRPTADGTGGGVLTQSASYHADRVIICGGLQSDILARLAGDEPGPAIVPFRGEYFRLRPERADLVHGLVYPVPDPAYPFLGVHFTPRVDGSVDIGPNAILATKREGYRITQFSPRDLAATVAWPGARRLFRQHWRAGVRELRGSLSKRNYVNGARDYIPSLRVHDVIRAGAGVRAQSVDADGSMVDDFRISRLGPITAVRNAPSPAATSSLAIAEHICAALNG